MKKRRNLSASVLSTSEYPYKRWYFHDRDESWYYHGPRKEVVFNTTPDFDSTVDTNLQDLVDYLHLHHMATTPSCQGHFGGTKSFQPIWEKLQKEEDLIRKKGMTVSDVETGEKFLFQNDDYFLPWESFKEFYADAGPNQKNGYLGFYVKNPDDVFHLRHLVTEPSTMNYFTEEDPINDRILFTIGVSKKDELEQAKEWKRWTRNIQKVMLGIY